MASAQPPKVTNPIYVNLKSILDKQEEKTKLINEIIYYKNAETDRRDYPDEFISQESLLLKIKTLLKLEDKKTLITNLKIIIESNPDLINQICVTDNHASYPLSLAIQLADPEIVRLLINKGAKVIYDDKSKLRFNPLPQVMKYIFFYVEKYLQIASKYFEYHYNQLGRRRDTLTGEIIKEKIDRLLIIIKLLLDNNIFNENDFLVFKRNEILIEFFKGMLDLKKLLLSKAQESVDEIDKYKTKQEKTQNTLSLLDKGSKKKKTRKKKRGTR